MKIKHNILPALFLTCLLMACTKTDFDENGYKIMEFQDSTLEAILLEQGLDRKSEYPGGWTLFGTDRNQFGNGDGKISIWELARAQYLDCAGKGIRHVKELRFCTDVDSLDLSGNAIDDELKSLKWKRLTYGNLSDNRLKGRFDMSLMANIQEINLSGNMITELSGISVATSLEKGDFSNNNLRGEVDITKLLRLATIDFTGNTGLTKVILRETYIGTGVLKVDAGTEVVYRNQEGQTVTPPAEGGD